MVDTILFDFFGTLVKYSANRKTVSFPLTHDYICRNITTIEYDAFISSWNQIFQQLERYSLSSQIEFSMDIVASEFCKKNIEGAVSHHVREIYDIDRGW